MTTRDRGSSLQLEDCVSRATGFLEASQLPHGEFPTSMHTDERLESGGIPESSPFATTFVVYALMHVSDARADAMIRRALAFLAEAGEAPGVWRYWTARDRRQIDADLDCTACAMFVLQRAAPELLPWDCAAVMLSNRDRQDLFKTWVRAPHARNDVDSVVNANVLFALGERDETATAVAFLNRVLQDGIEAGSYAYYLDPLALYYAVSRAFVHNCPGLAASRPAVVARVTARQQANGSFGNELETALALCTLANYGVTDDVDPSAASKWLLSRQAEDGSWPRRAFYCGPEAPATRRFWWGSHALTTALCLEALSKLNAPPAGPNVPAIGDLAASNR